MRQKLTRQMSIFSVTMRHGIGKELAAFSEILDATPKMLDLVYADPTRVARKDTGREGMTAEQVLRCVALKQFRNLSYEELAFHLEDLKSFRAFARMEMWQYPSSSSLQESIKPLSEETCEAVHVFLTTVCAAARLSPWRWPMQKYSMPMVRARYWASDLKKWLFAKQGWKHVLMYPTGRSMFWLETY